MCIYICTYIKLVYSAYAIDRWTSSFSFHFHLYDSILQLQLNFFCRSISDDFHWSVNSTAHIPLHIYICFSFYFALHKLTISSWNKYSQTQYSVLLNKRENREKKSLEKIKGKLQTRLKFTARDRKFWQSKLKGEKNNEIFPFSSKP